MAGKNQAAAHSRENEPEMLERYYSTLRVKLEHIRGSGTENGELLERLDGMLSSPGPTWKQAYEIQELMTELWREDMLNLEIKRALTQGERYLRPETHALYNEHAGVVQTGNTEGKRSLLRGLLADLHWRKTLYELGRSYLRSFRARVGLLCLTFLVVVLAALSLRAYYLGGGLDKDILSRIQGRMDIFYLLYASLVGIWGATFSMLTGLKSRADEIDFTAVRNMYSWSSIISRVAIGAGGGLLMYFFIKAGMLDGGIMPDFSVPPDLAKAVRAFLDASAGNNPELIKTTRLELSNQITTRDLNVVPLLTVWAFIAGFSEKLVPGLLSRTSARIPGAEGAKKKPVAPALDDDQPTTVSTSTTPAAKPTESPSTSENPGAGPR